ncbi:MAG: hypothetical protein ABIF12_00745 [bacterium]
MKRILKIFIMLIIILINSAICKDTDKKIYDLHNKISKNLLTLKKDYPNTQPKVYSLLDQVCKMYQFSKNTLKKKCDLKIKYVHLDKEYKSLNIENTNLKNELKSLTNKFDSKTKELENKNKILTKNTAILSIVSQEKKQMEIEINKLKEEQKELFLKTQNSDSKPNEITNNTNLEKNDLTDKYNNQLEHLHSVNITST